MSEQLKIGDVVYLKSGSPAMTVVELPQYRLGMGNNIARLVYFNGEVRHEDLINADALTQTPPLALPLTSSAPYGNPYTESELADISARHKMLPWQFQDTSTPVTKP